MASSNTYTDRYGNDVTLEELLKNKSDSEKKAIKYFKHISEGGCFSKKYVTDQDYLDLLNDQIGSIESRKQKALKKLGLDESQVQDIAPVCFQGFKLLKDDVKGINNDFFKFTESGKFVSATKELTWLFFGDEQVYVYRVRVDTVDNSLQSERTFEYFYKDVTAFSSESDSLKKKVPVYKSGCGGEKVEYVDKTVETESFKIVVPGETFFCALSPEDNNEEKINGMKQKLREKKRA